MPFALQAIATSALLTADEKERMAAYVVQLRSEQPSELRVDLAYDNQDAEASCAPLGAGIRDYVLRPAFEGPFFTRLHSLSAAMVRAWLRAVLEGAFYQV